MLGRPVVDGGFIVGTIIKPKLGLRPQPFADACYDFWLGGDFIKNDEPQGNQTFAPFKETVRAVNDAMIRAQDKTGQPKLFSFNITADDYREMIARGEFILETFGPNADHVAFLVDGYVAGPAAITTARRHVPEAVPALSPRRPRRRDLAEFEARLHRPSCSPRWRACRARPASMSARWASARWRARPATGSSPT